MKITIESTGAIVSANGLPARLWEGKTERGTPVIALITRLGVPEGTDASELERDLGPEQPTRFIVEGQEPVITGRSCTVCLSRDKRRPATHVARDAGGLEWFECGQHDPTDNVAETIRVELEPIAAWFDRHGLPLPGAASNVTPDDVALAERARHARALCSLPDALALRSIVGGWRDQDEVTLMGPALLARGLLTALDALAIVHGPEAETEAAELDKFMAQTAGGYARPAPRARTEAEAEALTALHRWLHSPGGDGELIEAAAAYHDQVESESPAECRRLEADEKAAAAARARADADAEAARRIAERANESARALFDRVGLALGIGMPAPAAEHEECSPDAPPPSPLAGRIIRTIVLDARAVDAATDEPSKLFMAHALRGAQMGWHARVKHPAEVDRVAELGAPKDEPTRSAWLFGFGVATRTPDPAAEPTPPAPSPAVAGVCPTPPAPSPAVAGVCRGCGCTEEDCSGCIAKTGMPCYWVEPGLCSACVNGVTDAMREYYQNELCYRAPETLNDNERRIIAAVEAEEKARTDSPDAWLGGRS